MNISIGTRGSRLALCQTNEVKVALLEHSPDLHISIQIIPSESDQQQNTPLDKLGEGMFVKTLEHALLDGKVDLIVHSLKDLPTKGIDGITTIPVLRRADPRDVLINRWNIPFRELPKSARIGTSSPRRAGQLKIERGDLRYLPIRGNIENRVAKASGSDYDGIVIAAAGVERLALESHIAEYLPVELSTPTPGQGALAAEVRSGDTHLIDLINQLQEEETTLTVEAERTVLRSAGSGCQIPIGALAVVTGDTLTLTAVCLSDDGNQVYSATLDWARNDPQGAGEAVYQILVNKGALGNR